MGAARALAASLGALAVCVGTSESSASAVGLREIPWPYKGYDSFPTNWFGTYTSTPQS